VPIVALPPVMPLTCQVTLVFEPAFDTIVLNCSAVVEVQGSTVFRATLLGFGRTCTVTVDVIVTVAVAVLVGSATDVAVTVTVGDEAGTVDGAVYRPDELIVPHALPEHPVPDRLHVTEVLLAPVTAVVNC
jgi:hypothetical protein